jgi:hypothetical protein
MKLFHKAKPEPPRFPAEDYEPVLRCSICTGERTACMRERATGRLREIQLIRSDRDLEDFCRAYGLRPEEIKTVY